MAAAEVIETQLKLYKIKRNSDVLELYLAKEGLTEMPDMSRFKQLKYLWLNHNKLDENSSPPTPSLNGLITRIDLKENNCSSYLKQRHLLQWRIFLYNKQNTVDAENLKQKRKMLETLSRSGSIYGENTSRCFLYRPFLSVSNVFRTLKHLTSLQILMLHNNWLTKVEKIVSEFKRLRWMHTLNLFNNPLTQDRDYRLYVIYHLPSVQLLDRQQISQRERDAAFGHCNQDRLRINQSLAFGQRKPDFIVEHLAPKRSFMNYPGRKTPIPHQKDISKRVNKEIKDSSEYAVASRIRRRSLMQFSTLDWSNVPTAQQKRLADEPMHLSQIIITQFR